MTTTIAELNKREKPLNTRTVQRGPRLTNYRAFTLACHILRYFIKRELTTVELCVASGAKYDSCARLVTVAREAGLIKPTGFGQSERGTKPMKYTMDLEQGVTDVGTMTVIDQAVLHIGRGMDYAEAVRKGFMERFGLMLYVDPGFVDNYTYKTGHGSLTPPQEMWIEGFARGWALYPAALLDWQKRAVIERREAKDSARRKGLVS